jgi:hypothetical protein
MFFARFGLALFVFIPAQAVAKAVGGLIGWMLAPLAGDQTGAALYPLLSIALVMLVQPYMERRWHSSDALVRGKQTADVTWRQLGLGAFGFLVLAAGFASFPIALAHHFGFIAQCASPGYPEPTPSGSSWSIPCTLDPEMYVMLLGAWVIMKPFGTSTFWSRRATDGVDDLNAASGR